MKCIKMRLDWSIGCSPHHCSLPWTLNACVPRVTEPNSWLAPIDDCFYLMVKFCFFVSLSSPWLNINFLCVVRVSHTVNMHGFVIQIYADFERLDPLMTRRSQPSLRIALEWNCFGFFSSWVWIQCYLGTWHPPLVSQICSVIISALVCSSYSVSHHRSLPGTRQASSRGRKVQLWTSFC